MRNLQERSQIALISLPTYAPPLAPLHLHYISHPYTLPSHSARSTAPPWIVAFSLPPGSHTLAPSPQVLLHSCHTFLINCATPSHTTLMPYLPSHSFTFSQLATACCAHTTLFLSFNVLLPHLLGHSHTSLNTEAPFSTRQQHPCTPSSSFDVLVPCFPHSMMAHQELQELLS